MTVKIRGSGYEITSGKSSDTILNEKTGEANAPRSPGFTVPATSSRITDQQSIGAAAPSISQ